MSSGKKARIGVIGLGMGRTHLRSYRDYTRSEVIAICDKDKTLLKSIANEYKVPHVYTDINEMLDAPLDLDGVSVALPNYLHASTAIKVLSQGINVLCEKPMAMNAEEASRMVAAAKKNGKRLMINFNQRFTDHSMYLKRMVEKGTIGDIYYCRTAWHRRRGGIPRFGGWFGIKEMSGGGPLIDIGVHRLDLALWFIGYPHAVSVSSSTYSCLGHRLAEEAGVKFDVEDLAAAFIRLENGATLVLETSWDGYSEKREDMVTHLFGTKGGIIQRNIGETYNFEAKVFTEDEGMLKETVLLGSVGRATKNSMMHFVDCILDDEEPIATGEQGLEIMKIIDAIYLSAKQGREIQLSQK